MVDLYSEMQDRGLEIMGFPCNQVGVGFTILLIHSRVLLTVWSD